MLKLRRLIACSVLALGISIPGGAAWAVTDVTVTFQPGTCAGSVNGTTNTLELAPSAVSCDVEVFLTYTNGSGLEMAGFAIELFGTGILDMTAFAFTQSLGMGALAAGFAGDNPVSINADQKPASGKLGDLSLIPLGLGDIALGGAWNDTGFPPGDHSFDNHQDLLATVVPEPSTFLLVLAGMAGLAISGRRPRQIG